MPAHHLDLPADLLPPRANAVCRVTRVQNFESHYRKLFQVAGTLRSLADNGVPHRLPLQALQKKRPAARPGVFVFYRRADVTTLVGLLGSVFRASLLG